ncbi:MAG: disulfide bond formation protein B [Xanthomonadales bacterium]|nr:disulfide bond formation protein B [Xanthomonadales bacterium]ODU94614.1 MAG: disulfide bond formation protein B [Rhodanobacter sp. SCN 66-43]OJY85196.1 MAG: disulfide bond formation protein B [Xanthomonadales bacterium 66-474]
MNPFRWSFRAAYLIGFLICAALLGYALYAEQQLHLTPCNLCVLQRVAFVWMGLWFLVGGLHAPRGGGRRAYAVLVLIGAVFGIVTAARQLWLQSLPADQVPACGAGVDMLLTMVKAGSLPFGKFVMLMFSGSGDCAQVTWRFLGLSMAGWTLIWYVLLGAWALLPRPRRNRLVDTRPPGAKRI